jgi:hypothetical protein
MKNRIILDNKTGELLNVIFDSTDLSKTSADLKGTLEMINNKMTLHLLIQLNDNFEVDFRKKEE